MFAKTIQKVTFICGDFSIDLLNLNKHKMTEEFINAMYSMRLYSKITRPSWITSHCATLIAGMYPVFTNIMEDNTVSGPLLNSISDHLPVFVVYDCNYRKVKEASNFKYKRVRTEESMNAFKMNY